jgi:hypothetical protein
MRSLLAFLLLAATGVAAHAADREKFGTLPEPPEPPATYKSTPPAPPPANPPGDDAIPEPEVVITTKGQERHEEYRIGGRLYMIKVIPQIGEPYYLIDNEGRGQFTRSDFAPKVSPPTWVIKRF